MRVTICLLVLSSLTTMLSATTASYIPFTMQNGLMIVEAEVDSKQGYYIFDTGASDLLLNAKVQGGDVVFATMTGEVSTTETKVSEISLAGLVKKNVPAYHMDLTEVENLVGVDVAGVVGGKLFAENYIHINFVDQLIYISDSYTATSTALKLDYTMIDNVPVVEVKVEGQELSFVLDSGASAHFIDESVIASLQKVSTAAGQINVVTADNNARKQSYIMESLSIAGNTWQDVRMIAGDFSQLLSSVEVSGLLSISALPFDDITIDTSRRTLYLK